MRFLQTSISEPQPLGLDHSPLGWSLHHRMLTGIPAVYLPGDNYTFSIVITLSSNTANLVLPEEQNRLLLRTSAINIQAH